jgi:IMP dehydrogenase
VPYKGALYGVVDQLVGGLRSGMGYCGAGSIPELQKKARFVRVTAAGHREAHVHDVIITKEAPNYQLD